MKHSIKITFKGFLSLVKSNAKRLGAHNYYETYDELPILDKDLIKEKYMSIDQFIIAVQSDIDEQIENYEDAYIGENAQAGNLFWFDGEVLCCEETIEGWFRTHVDESSNKHFDWGEVAEYVKEVAILSEFSHHRNNKKD